MAGRQQSTRGIDTPAILAIAVARAGGVLADVLDVYDRVQPHDEDGSLYRSLLTSWDAERRRAPTRCAHAAGVPSAELNGRADWALRPRGATARHMRDVPRARPSARPRTAEPARPAADEPLEREASRQLRERRRRRPFEAWRAPARTTVLLRAVRDRLRLLAFDAWTTAAVGWRAESVARAELAQLARARRLLGRGVRGLAAWRRAALARRFWRLRALRAAPPPNGWFARAGLALASRTDVARRGAADGALASLRRAAQRAAALQSVGRGVWAAWRAEARAELAAARAAHARARARAALRRLREAVDAALRGALAALSWRGLALASVCLTWVAHARATAARAARSAAAARSGRRRALARWARAPQRRAPRERAARRVSELARAFGLLLAAAARGLQRGLVGARARRAACARAWRMTRARSARELAGWVVRASARRRCARRALRALELVARRRLETRLLALDGRAGRALVARRAALRRWLRARRSARRTRRQRGAVAAHGAHGRGAIGLCMVADVGHEAGIASSGSDADSGSWPPGSEPAADDYQTPRGPARGPPARAAARFLFADVAALGEPARVERRWPLARTGSPSSSIDQ